MLNFEFLILGAGIFVATFAVIIAVSRHGYKDEIENNKQDFIRRSFPFIMNGYVNIESAKKAYQRKQSIWHLIVLVVVLVAYVLFQSFVSSSLNQTQIIAIFASLAFLGLVCVAAIWDIFIPPKCLSCGKIMSKKTEIDPGAYVAKMYSCIKCKEYFYKIWEDSD